MASQVDGLAAPPDADAAAAAKKRAKNKAKKAKQKATKANKPPPPDAPTFENHTVRGDAGAKGRGLFAAEAVDVGDRAVRAVPALSVVFDGDARDLCGFCFAANADSGWNGPKRVEAAIPRGGEVRAVDEARDACRGGDGHIAAVVAEAAHGLARGDVVESGAGKERDAPDFQGSSLGRVPLVSADFWTSDHLPERPRRVDAFSGTLASKRRRISAQVESVGGVPLPRGAGAAGALEEALALAEGASFLVARRPHVAPCAGCATFAVCADCATRGLGDWHRSGECAALANVARDDAALAGDSAPLRLLLRYAAAKRHGDWCVGAKEPLSWIGTLVAPRTRCLGDRDARSLAAASGVPLDDVHRLVGQIHSNAARISRDGRAAGCALSAHVGFATRGARRLRPTSPRASATVAARALSAGRRARAESHRSVRRSAGATSTRPSERRVPAQANHDCAPNCAARVDAAGMVALTALCDLAAGDELTISYVDERLPHAERRKILRDHYGFDCACGRCAAERKALLAKARHRAR